MTGSADSRMSSGDYRARRLPRHRTTVRPGERQVPDDEAWAGGAVGVAWRFERERRESFRAFRGAGRAFGLLSRLLQMLRSLAGGGGLLERLSLQTLRMCLHKSMPSFSA